jgi:hypothetical protein
MRQPSVGIARIVIRPGGSSPEHPQSGLLILGVLANTSALLKPGRVYEITDYDGEALTIKDLGESAIASTSQYKAYENLGKAGHIESWATRYFDIVRKWGWWVVGTLAEARGRIENGSLSEDFVRAAEAAPEIPERTG